MPIRVGPTSSQRSNSGIRSALGNDPSTIEHIGSTSVPGLPSKDIIDIQVTVESEDALVRVADALTTRGWRRAPDSWGDHPVPGPPADPAEWRKVFLDEPVGTQPAHVHVRVAGRANA